MHTWDQSLRQYVLMQRGGSADPFGEPGRLWLQSQKGMCGKCWAQLSEASRNIHTVSPDCSTLPLRKDSMQVNGQHAVVTLTMLTLQVRQRPTE